MIRVRSAVRRVAGLLCSTVALGLVAAGCGGGHASLSPRDDGMVAVAAQSVALATDTGAASARSLGTPTVLQAPGTDFQFTIQASDLGGVAGATVHLQFDPAVFAVLEVTRGPSWGPQALTAANPSGVAGRSAFAVADTTACPTGSGLIVTFHMQALAGATPQNATIGVTGVLAGVTGDTIGRGAARGRTGAPRRAALIGDLMGTGGAEIGSAIKLLRVVRGLDAAPASIAQWDCNGSNSIDEGDAARLLRCLVGLEPWPLELSAVTFGQRQAAVDAVKARAAALTGANPEADNQALADYMAAHPEHFEAAGVVADSGGCWGRFRDGRLFLICNTTREEQTVAPGPPVPTTGGDEASPPASRPALAASRRPRQATATSGPAVPASGKAAVLTAMKGGQAYTYSPSQPVQHIVNDARYDIGVAVGTRCWATVDALALVREVGVFYLDAHGGAAVTRGGAIRSAAWTTTPVDAANDAQYATELTNGELVVTAVLERGELKHEVYGFTPDFVRAKMSFAAGSVAVVSACYLAAMDMRDAFIAKGARAYCGWTAPVRLDIGSRVDCFLFDRLRGTVFTHGNPPFEPDPAHPILETPPQRGFPLATVAQDIHNRGWDVSAEVGRPTAVFKVYPDTGDFLLNPVITSAYVGGTSSNPTHNSLVIKGLFGYFGTQTASVSVGGNPVPARWVDAQTVIADPLPSTGLSAAGPVRVFIGGAASCRTPLTEWQVPFTYTDVLGGLTRAFSGTMHLRAHINGHRNAMHGAVSFYYGDGGAPSIGDCGDAVGWSYSGTETYPSGMTVTASGSGGILAEDFMAADPYYRYSAGLLSAKRLGLSFSASTGSAHLTQSTPPYAPVEIDGVRLEMKDTDFDANVTAAEDPLGNFKLAFDLDDSYAIPAGTWTRTWGKRVYTFTWQRAQARFAPQATSGVRSLAYLLDCLPWHGA